MEIEDFIQRLVDPELKPSGVSSRCPGHPDQVRSLVTNPGDNGGIVLHCHAGCKTEDIVRAMGLSMSDLAGNPYVVKVYSYTDEDGAPLWRVERWANPKTFKCVPGLPAPAERVLYNLPALKWARENHVPVFVCEGEKDVDTLAALSIPATCNVGGAGRGKWLPHYGQWLAGLDVVIVADNDAPGKEHARHIAEALTGVAKTATLMMSPYGKDVSDLLDAGYSIDALQLLPESDNVASYLAAQVPTKKIRWGWKGYLPLGKLAIVEGDPGDGKSLFTLDLAARWSTGAPMPDGSRGVMSGTDVVLISAEDDEADTIKPRLIAAGANLERVHLITHGATPEIPFELTDLPMVEKLMLTVGAKLLVIDPLSAMLSERTDSHNDASTRRALYPLKMLAQRTGACVLVVRHLTKGSAGGRALYRGNGSIGFIGAARAAFVIANIPDQPGTKALACQKMNVAARPVTLTFTVAVADDRPYIVWGEALDMDAQGILDGPERVDQDHADEVASKRRARAQEVEFLLDVLRDGPMTWVEIKDAGKQAGFAEVSLRRARADAGLLKVIGSHGNSTVTWARPVVTNGDPTCSLAPVAQGSESQGAEVFGEQTPVIAGSDNSVSTMDTVSAGPTEGDQNPPVTSAPTALAQSEPLHSGTQNPEQLEQVNKWADGQSLSVEESEDEKRARVRALPLVCEVCATEIEVTRYMRPYWTVRCWSHHPRSYRPGDDQ